MEEKEKVQEEEEIKHEKSIQIVTSLSTGFFRESYLSVTQFTCAFFKKRRKRRKMQGPLNFTRDIGDLKFNFMKAPSIRPAKASFLNRQICTQS